MYNTLLVDKLNFVYFLSRFILTDVLCLLWQPLLNGVNNKLKVQVFFNLLEINQLLMHLNCNSLHGEKWLFFIFCIILNYI